MSRNYISTMKASFAIILVLITILACNKEEQRREIQSNAFDEEVKRRGILVQPEEKPETPIGKPSQNQEGQQNCEYQKVYAAAGHNEFLPSYPYSGIYPSQMYFLKDFDNGGLRIFPAKLNPVTLSWSLANSTGNIVCKMDNPQTSYYRECEQNILSSEVKGATPANIEFEYKQIHESSQIDLEIDASFSGFGVKVKNMFDYNNRQRKSFYWVELTQVYYTVEADITAQSPSDWFKSVPNVSDLTEDEPLVYVHSLKYGRRLFLAVSSNYESERVANMLQACYDGIAAGGGINLNYEQKQTYLGTEIKAFVMGGGGVPAVEVITNINKLESYMKQGANYSKESPGELIGFTLRYLSDNSIARHVSTAEYTKRNCSVIPNPVYSQQAYGGDGGSPFDWKIPNGSSIIAIKVRYGDYVDGIGIKYKDKDGSIKEYYSGGGGGTERIFSINAGLKITKISGKYGRVVDGIQFYFSDGSNTPYYGGGGPFSISIPSGKGAIGFYGRSGRVIDKIGVIYQ